MIKLKNVDLSFQSWIKSQSLGSTLGLQVATGPPDNIQPTAYHVNVDGGSDNFDGLTPDKPFATIEKARSVSTARIDWAGSPWANQDVVYVWPGVYPENITGGFYGMTVIGLGWAYDLNGEMGVTIKAASGSPFDSTSHINGIFANLCFASPTDDGTEVLFQADNFNRMLMIDCLFSGVAGASPTTVRGFEVVKDMTGSKILNCDFLMCRTGLYLVADNANSKQITGNEFKGLYVTGGDVAGIYFDVNCTPSMTRVRNCDFDGGGSTLALGCDDNSSGELVHFFNCNFEASACDPASGAGHYNNCYLNGTLMT